MSRKRNYKVTEGLRNKGYTVSGWSRARGFKPVTVYQLIYKAGGYTGEHGLVARKIKAELHKEGVI